MEGQPLNIEPITDYEPRKEHLELLQKTPYQDPKARRAFNERKERLVSFSQQIRHIQLGVFLKTPSRVFSPEWTNDMRERTATLLFEHNLQAFYIHWSGHRDIKRLSIRIKFTSVRKIFVGWEFGNPFLLFLLEWAPSYESEANVLRTAERQKKDQDNIRERLNYLEDSHRVGVYSWSYFPLTKPGRTDQRPVRILTLYLSAHCSRRRSRCCGAARQVQGGWFTDS
jgi:RNA-dependent RNA polymerase